jgi:hypothetical protein
MQSHSILSSRRVQACVSSLLLVAGFAVGCGNNGGSGDGVYDNSIPPGGASNTAGKSGGKSGAQNSNAGSSAQSGSSGATGNAGASGSAGKGGASGSGGAAGNGASGSSGAMGMSGNGAGGVTGAAGAGGGSAGGGSLTCGNGTIEAGEACDSGMQNAMGGASTAGGGGEDSGGFPSVVPKYGENCSNTCFKVGTPECLNCEFAGDCFESVDNCLGPPDTPFNAAQQTVCFAVMSCIQKSNCFDGTNTIGKCYCGSLSIDACGAAPFTGAGSPDGACASELRAGFPTLTTNSAVIANFAATQLPSGAATKRLSCQKGSNLAACSDICGFKSGGPAFP